MDYPVNAVWRLLCISLATVLGISLTLALGRWQLGRAAQKEALAASMELQGRKSPLTGATLLAAPDLPALVHQHARVRGVWDAAHTIYLDNRQMDGRFGFYVLTPLRLEGSQQALVVQRGWVQRNFEARRDLQPVQTPAGVVEVEGRMALPPSKLYEPGAATPARIRQNLDLDQYRAETGLALLPIVLLQTGAASEGLTRDWPPVNLGLEKHYGYALQWFGMAAVMAALFLWYQIIRPARQRLLQRKRNQDSVAHAQ